MAAVNSATVASGSTINVCPGLYQEQVIISKPLTLQGVGASNSTNVTIVPAANPSVTEDAVLEEALTPVVWVTSGPVTVQNIRVFNQSGTCSTPPTVGFYYESGASGKLNNVVYESLNNSVPPCPGWGIWVENANSSPTSVTISNSFSDSGILAVALDPQPDIRLTIEVTGNHFFVNKALGAGIFLSQVGGKVSSNLIQPAPSPLGGYLGIYDDAPAVPISGNTIVGDDFVTDITQETGTGIGVNQNGATIKSNKISNITDGMNLGCHSAVVTGNTITLATTWILEVPSSFAGANTFRSVGGDVASGGCP